MLSFRLPMTSWAPASSSLTKRGISSKSYVRSASGSCERRERTRRMKGSAGAGRYREAAMSAQYDTLIVGAGYAGSIMAERLTSQLGQKGLVVDRREPI